MKSVLILIVIFFVVRALKNKLEARKIDAPAADVPPQKESAPAPSRSKAEDMVLDPVCGSYVPISAALRADKGGRTVYFCSEECRERF